MKDKKKLLYNKIGSQNKKILGLLFDLLEISLKKLDNVALKREIINYLNDISDDYTPFLCLKDPEKGCEFLYIDQKEDKVKTTSLDNVDLDNLKDDEKIDLTNIIEDKEFFEKFNKSQFVNKISYFDEKKLKDRVIGFWKNINIKDTDINYKLLNDLLTENISIIFKNALDRDQRQKEKIELEEKIQNLNIIHDFTLDFSKIDRLEDAAEYLIDLISTNLYIDYIALYYKKHGYEEKFHILNSTENLNDIQDSLKIELDEVDEEIFMIDDFAQIFPDWIKNTELKLCSKIQFENKIKGLIFLSESWGNIDDSNYTSSQLELINIISNLSAINFNKIEKHERLHHYSVVDKLTDIYNRRYFDQSLESEFKRSERNNSTFSLIMIDIDKFKDFNDTYGHKIGDKVLVKFSRAVEDVIRGNDIFCRYGGEEFALILPETRKDKAYYVAERIRKKIEETKVNTDEGNLSVTISLGISERKAEDTMKNIVEKADKALYHSKETGRNKTTIFEKDMND